MGYRQDADNRELGALSQDDLLTWVHRREMTGNLVGEGTSRWHPVDEVRQRFEELRKGGTYLRRGEAISGPFATIQAQQRIDSADKRFTHVRHGISGPWLELTEELRLAALQSSSHPSSFRRRKRLANPRFWEFSHAFWESFPGTAPWLFVAAVSAIIFLVGLLLGALS